MQDEDLPQRPDYSRAIYETLRRIESLLSAGHFSASNDRDEFKPTLTVNEAAAYLGVGRSKFYELVRTKQVPSIRIGRRILIPARGLESNLRGAAARRDNDGDGFSSY